MGRTETGALFKVSEQAGLPPVKGLSFYDVNPLFTRLVAESDDYTKIESCVKKVTKLFGTTAFIYNIYDSDRVYMQFFKSGKLISYCLLAADMKTSVKRNFATYFCEFFFLPETDIQLVRKILKLIPELSYGYLELLVGILFCSIPDNREKEFKAIPREVLSKEVKSLLDLNKIPVLKVVETASISARSSQYRLDCFMLILQQETFNSSSFDNYELFRLSESAAPELIIPKTIFSFCDEDLLVMAKGQLFVFRNISELHRNFYHEKPVGLFKVNLGQRTVSAIPIHEDLNYQAAIALDLGLPINSSIEDMELITGSRWVNNVKVGPLKIDSSIDKFRLLDEFAKLIGKVVIRGVNIINYLDNNKYLHVVTAEEKNIFLGEFPNNITGIRYIQYLHFIKVEIPFITTVIS